MKFGLLSRGLLVVAFPVVTQIVFVVALCFLLRNVESGIEREYFKRTVVEKWSTFMMRVLDDMVAQNENENPALLAEVDRLILECAPFPSLQQKARRLKQLMIQCIRARQDSNVNPSDYLKYRQEKFYADVGMTAVAIKDMRALVNALQAESSDIELPQKTKTAILITLLLGAGVTVPIGILLGYFYARSIQQPVRQVMINSKLLSQRAQLLPEMTGSDEVSELDRLLHRVAIAIDEVAQEEQSMLTNAAGLICSLTKDGHFLEASNFALDMLGIPAEELCLMQVQDITAPQMVLDVEKHFRELPESGETGSFELTLMHQSGRQVLTRWSAFWGPGEKVFAVATDITGEKQADQMKTEFLSMIIQGLRTPLASILSRSKSIASELNKSAEEAQELESVERNIGKLLELTEQAITYQSLNTAGLVLNRTNWNLGDIFLDVSQLLDKLVRSKHIKITIPDHTPTVRCDQQQIFQLVLNLVSNAIKFSPENSTIDLRVAKNESAYEVHVIDHGPGVPESLRNEIFEPFNQGRLQGQGGSGLGLATCKLIVEAHGGTIGVHSRTDSNEGAKSGSDFWFTLPR